MSRRKQQTQHIVLPPAPPPRNPFATTVRMRRGVEVHEKSRGARRRADRMALQRLLRGAGGDEE